MHHCARGCALVPDTDPHTYLHVPVILSSASAIHPPHADAGSGTSRGMASRASP